MPHRSPVSSLILVWCSVAAGCAELPAPVSAGPRDAGPAAAHASPTLMATVPYSAAEALAGWSTLRRMTDEPVEVDPVISTACWIPIREQGDPHVARPIHVYMNAAAAVAHEEQAVPYPVGAVIAKRKLGRDTIGAGDDGCIEPEPDDVALMIKRAPGYDAAHGDWEYVWAEGERLVSAGPLASCVQCHHAARDSDYVKGDWRRDGAGGAR